jgi:membrane protease YdiL (CAAX protease family)
MAVPDREVEAKLRSLNLNSVPVYVLVGIGYALVHSLFEEYYWRWFVFGNLKTLLRLPLAIAISSLGFAAHHVLVLANYFGWWSPWTYLCSLGVATGGAIWAWLYHRHQTLFGPWISHGLVDAVIFVIGYELAFS